VKALIIGAGVVGDATGYALQERGWTVAYHDPPKGLQASSAGVQVVLLCVPTPQGEHGACDLTTITQACEKLQQEGYIGPVGIRSTVAVGTGAHLARCYPGMQVFSWPEFLRDKDARRMALHPAYTVFGFAGEPDHRLVRLLLGADVARTTPRVITTRAGAEFIKYATNCLLATSVGMANELAAVARECYGLDWNDLLPPLLTKDTVLPRNITVTAQGGYGGKCLPKDTAAFLAQHGADTLPILAAVHAANATRRPEEYAERGQA
jgi:UDPglucose 6-dehydrogenase